MRVWSCPHPSGPPAVLLHATGETAADWDPVAPQLSNDRDVYAVDLRGHGQSDWPGTYSLQTARRRRCRCSAGTACSTGGLGRSLARRAGRVQGRRVASRADPPARARGCRAAARSPGGTPERPQGQLSFDWAVVEQVRPEIDDPDPAWPSIVAGIRAPTLVIGGGRSSFVPQEHVAELVRLLPDGRLVTIEAGHLVHANRAEEFSQHLQAFLGSPRDRTGGPMTRPRITSSFGFETSDTEAVPPRLVER